MEAKVNLFTYQFKGIFIWSVFFGVIANIDLILLFMLFPAVLLAFVGVFVVRLRIGVKLSSFNAFSDRSFFNFEALFNFVLSSSSYKGFLKLLVIDRFYLSSW